MSDMKHHRRMSLRCILRWNWQVGLESKQVVKLAGMLLSGVGLRGQYDVDSLAKRLTRTV